MTIAIDSLMSWQRSKIETTANVRRQRSRERALWFVLGACGLEDDAIAASRAISEFP